MNTGLYMGRSENEGELEVTGEAELERYLRELEEKLLKPEIRTSSEEISKLLADEFFEIGSSGVMWYKSDGIAEEGLGIVRMTLSHFELHLLSEDIALVTYRIFNEDKKQNTLRSSIWKCRNGEWKMYFHQGTPVHV